MTREHEKYCPVNDGLPRLYHGPLPIDRCCCEAIRLAVEEATAAERQENSRLRLEITRLDRLVLSVEAKLAEAERENDVLNANLIESVSQEEATSAVQYARDQEWERCVKELEHLADMAEDAGDGLSAHAIREGARDLCKATALRGVPHE